MASILELLDGHVTLELLADGMMNEAEHAVQPAQVFLVAGTSAVVLPAANLAPFARKAGAKTIEINTVETAASGLVNCVLLGPAGELLPRLL